MRLWCGDAGRILKVRHGEHEPRSFAGPPALEAIRLAYVQFPDRHWYIQYRHSVALAALGRCEELNNLLVEIEAKNDDERVRETRVRAVEVLRANGYASPAQDLAERTVEWLEAEPDDETETYDHRFWYGRVLNLAGRPDEAHGVFDALVDEFPGDVVVRGVHGWWLFPVLPRHS